MDLYKLIKALYLERYTIKILIVRASEPDVMIGDICVYIIK